MTHFLSLEVRHWRGLESRALSELASGLNLVYGPNEAGKSRLFEALRFALWESYKGEPAYKKALDGWFSTERPWVAVAFEHQGRRYRLEKQFLQGGYARLEGGGITLKDKDAEERLQELLETGENKGRSVLGKEERGLWRLLWIEQGESRLSPSEDLNPQPRSQLQDLLSQEIGEVTAGPMGQRVLEKARQEWARYWTPTGQPTGELRKLAAAERSALEARDRAKDKRNEQREEAANLERVQRELETLDPRISEQRVREEAARERAEAAEAARRALESQAAKLEMLAVQVTEAQGALARRRAKAAEIVETEAAVKAIEADLMRIDTEIGPQKEALRLATTQLEDAKAAREAAETAARRASRQALRLERQAQLEELEARAKKAKSAAEELDQWTRKLAANPVSDQQVQRLEALDHAAREAQARLEGASAVVQVEALQEITVRQDAIPTPSQTFKESASKEPASKEPIPRKLARGESLELRFSRATGLEIGGIARLQVLPGGEGLEALRGQVETCRRALTIALDDLGVTTVVLARDRLQERQRGEGERRAASKALQDHAPEGLEALNVALQEARGRVESLGEDEASESFKMADMARTEADRVVAEEAQEAASVSHEAVLKKSRDLQTRRASLAQTAVHKGEQLERLRRDLAEQPGEADLASTVQTFKVQQGEALLQREGLESRFREAGGEAAQADLMQAEQALRQLEERRSELRRTADRAAARLSGMGIEGAHEELQEKEAALQDVQTALERLQRRANAARRLREALESERRQAQHRLTAPVRQRIEPYLREVFPGSTLAVDENWQVLGLQTADQLEGFDALSGGAQEQLSLLVRVGLGEILAGDGRLPLILDDALVNTDAERRETLLRILGRASAHLQIIVFTCHDDNYDALGAHKVFRLPASRVGAQV